MGNLVGSKEKFAKDMADGEAFEERLRVAMENSFPNRFYWQKHKNCTPNSKHCKCYDLEDLVEQHTIECKRDWKARETGNLCFEMYLLDPKILKADYLAQEPWEGTVLWFRVDELRKTLNQFLEADYRPIKGGDDNRTEMLVLNGKIFLKQCKHIRIDLTKQLPAEMFI